MQQALHFSSDDTAEIQKYTVMTYGSTIDLLTIQKNDFKKPSNQQFASRRDCCNKLDDIQQV
jgi:hypothetical protein